MKNKTIVLGITGSIAAYKSAELIRIFVKAGAGVIPVMTKNACRFITPLTVQTLSKNKVYSDMFETVSDWEIEHVCVAKKADVLLIAPASANVIAKLAAGLADDALTTLALAVKCPVVICPAMNGTMYKNKITQHNIENLKKLGYIFIGPETGELACGDDDAGRMTEPKNIADEIRKLLK
jgi:phosphopantothenoylcysteine decarboxylase/phosphopantothenate--cysteine ligase